MRLGNRRREFSCEESFDSGVQSQQLQITSAIKRAGSLNNAGEAAQSQCFRHLILLLQQCQTEVEKKVPSFESQRRLTHVIVTVANHSSNFLYENHLHSDPGGSGSAYEVSTVVFGSQ